MTSRHESRQQGVWRWRLPLYPLLCAAGCFIVSLFVEVQVLRVGDPGSLWKVSPGDRFVLRYTHSMYGVPVSERFLIGDGEFTLFHVDSTAAALEYFGLEHGGENNVRRTLKSFRIPAGSIGHHQLLFRGHVVELSTLAGENPDIPVCLVTMSVFKYLTQLVRR